jgi:glutamate racemase
MARSLRAEAPIGIFDSGLGGLAVLREIRRALPREDVIYLGDTARRPYGPQPVQRVREYTVEISRFLVEQGAKAVIIACNTASVAGAEAARRCFPEVPVLGMVEPGVWGALQATKNKRIGVWGTALTIDSAAHEQAILELDPDAQVLGVACPELLRLAEKGQIDHRRHLMKLARRYFTPIGDFDADVLILGCTDLTCVRDIAEAVAGERVTVVDPAREVTSEARRGLEARGTLRIEDERSGSYQYLMTGEDKEEFATFTSRFLQVPHLDVTRIPLEDVRQGTAVSSERCN